MRSRPKTLFGVMIEAGGILAASRALTYLACWAIVSHKLGHEASVDEFTEYWRSSRATTYRDRVALTKSLPPGWDIERMHSFVWAARRQYVSKIEADLTEATVMRVVAEMRFEVAS